MAKSGHLSGREIGKCGLERGSTRIEQAGELRKFLAQVKLDLFRSMVVKKSA